MYLSLFSADVVKGKPTLAVIQQTEVLIRLGYGDDICICNQSKNSFRTLTNQTCQSQQIFATRQPTPSHLAIYNRKLSHAVSKKPKPRPLPYMMALCQVLRKYLSRKLRH